MAQKKRSLADRIKTPEKSEMTAMAQENALKKLQGQKETAKKKKNVRVSVDFPEDIYVAMKEEAEIRGQTHRGFVLALVREYLSRVNV